MARKGTNSGLLGLTCLVVVGGLATGSRPAHAYSETTVSGGGTITGTVKFEGKAPKLILQIDKDTKACGKSKDAERLVVGSGGGVANAVVYLKEISKGKAAGKDSPRLDQKACQYIPHVQVAMKGSKLEIINSDGVLHNVHGYLKGRTTFNLAMPIKDQKIKKKLKKEGVLEIICDAGHGWMSAYVFVSEHPYAVTTDANGKFTLTDVPAGTYTVEMWHEGWKTTSPPVKGATPKYEDAVVQGQKITVASGATATADFVLK